MFDVKSWTSQTNYIDKKQYNIYTPHRHMKYNAYEIQ